MAAGSGVTIEIDANALPIIPGVLEIASQNKSGGMNTNREHFGPGVEFAAGVSDELRDLIFDPQTSGGLLISVAAEAADEATGKATDTPEFRPFLSDPSPRQAAKSLRNRVNHQNLRTANPRHSKAP